MVPASRHITFNELRIMYLRVIDSVDSGRVGEVGSSESLQLDLMVSLVVLGLLHQ